MGWINCLRNGQAIENLYSEIPSLKNVRLMEMSWHQDGPRVTMRIDLNQFPDRPPRKWLAGGFNRAQVTLVFTGIANLNVRGWNVDNVVDITIEAQSGGVSLAAIGHETVIEADCLFGAVEKVGGYCDTSVGDPYKTGDT